MCDTDESAIDRINAAMNDAIEAQENGYFDFAVSRARTAWMLIAALPDSDLQDERLRWKPEPIKAIVDELSALAKTTGSNNSEGSPGGIIHSFEIGYTRG